MRLLSRSHRIKTILSLLTIAGGFLWVVGASAEPPAGIIGEVTVQNDASNPVPVVMKREELVLLREGYTVPPGKRLLIDDMSVRCTIASNFFGDFPQAPPRASAILRLVYPSDTQDYSVGTAESTSVVEQTGDGRPAVSASAGRRMAIFADEGATLFGLCSGLTSDFPSTFISAGTGRLIDHP